MPTVAKSAILPVRRSRYLFHQIPGRTCPVVKYAPTAATNPIIAARPFSFSAFSLNIVITSEDAKKEIASDGVRNKPRDDTHHCPATIVGLCELLRGFQSFAIVRLYNHLGLSSKEIVLPKLIRSYGHRV